MTFEGTLQSIELCTGKLQFVFKIFTLSECCD